MKSYDKTLTRLILILTKLSNDELPTIKDLSEEFNVGIRTIQRDLYERLTYFPIEKNSLGQLKFIDGFTLDRCTLEDEEMLLVYLAMSQVKNINDGLENKVDHLFSKLLNPSFSTPYFIKSGSFENIDFDSDLLNSIEDAIEKFYYININFSDKSIHVEPYKIVCIDGIWYLFAKDMGDDKIKTYTISQILSIETLDERFELKTDVHGILDNVHSSCFDHGNNFKVKINIDSNISHYFKSKKVLPTQKILEENNDGSLIAQFEVTHDEDIDNIIKSWLPDIKVIEPIRYKEKLENELRDYLSI